MGKINNTSTYPVSNTIDGSDIVIGSENGNGGDTVNFLMSGIANYMTGQISLANVCSVGSTTATTMDIADTLTLSKATGTGLQVDSNANIGNRLNVAGNTALTGDLQITGALDANSTADIADTLTLSKATGTGLQVDANVNIDGETHMADKLYLDKPTGNGLEVTSNATIGGSLTVDSTAVFTDAGSSISAAGLISTAGNILALGTVGGSFLATDSAGAPLSASATGTTGSIVADANYIYVCTATDTWKRVAIATW